MRESNSLYCSPVASFYCIRVREHKICQCMTGGGGTPYESGGDARRKIRI